MTVESYSVAVAKLQHNIESSDKRWRRFVKDHRTLILETSVTVKVPAEKMHRYRYRMRELLVELGAKPYLEWIVMWINDLQDRSHVVYLTYLIIPSVDQLQALWSQYGSYVKKLA